MKIVKTRNYLEARVGACHCVELVLNVRRDHFDWFNADADENLEEIFRVFSSSVIPLHCGPLIELFWHKKDPQRFPLVEGSLLASWPKGKKSGGKRKRGKKAAVAVGQAQIPLDEKPHKDVYYVQGEYRDLRICYKVRDIDISNTVTLVYNNTNLNNAIVDDKVKASVGFSQLHKLPKRFELWVYPLGETDPPCFYRPEMVPIMHLFKDAPAEESGKQKSKKKKQK